MITRRIAWTEIDDLGMAEIARRPWRHGNHVAYVVEIDGKHWRFEVAVHTQEGWQTEGDGVEAVEVREVEKLVKTWEPVQ